MPVLAMVGSMIPQIAGSLVSGIGSVLRGIVSGISSAFSFVSGVLKQVVGLVSGAIMAFVSIVKSSLSALMAFSKTVAKISNQTGMSTKQSVGMVNRMGALGFSKEETSAIYGSREMNPALFNMRANALGAPEMGDANFEVKLQKWFQGMSSQGPNGFLQARAKLDSLYGGQASESVLRMVNMDPATTQRELDYGNKVQSQLGVSPETVERTNSGISMLLNRISVFVETVKMRFAAELLPTLEAAFGFISEMMASNAGNIAGTLKSVGAWMFTELPGLIIGGLETVVSWANTFIDVIGALAQGFFSAMQGLASKQGGLYKIVMFFAGFIDNFLNIGTYFAAGLSAVVQLFINLASRIPFYKKKLESEGVDTTYRTMEERGHMTIAARGGLSSATKTVTAAFDAEGFQDFAKNGLQPFNEKLAGAKRFTSSATNVINGAKAYIGTPAEQQATLANGEMVKGLKEATEESANKIVGAIDRNGKKENGGAVAAVMGHVGASYAMRSARLRRT